MMKNVRRNTKLIIWLVVAAFVFWGVGSLVASLHEVTQAAGELFGRKVSHRVFDRAYHHMAYLAQQTERPALPDVLASDTWQHLMLVQAARREGIQVADENVLARLKSLLPPPEKTPSDFYENWARYSYRASERDFEESLRDELSIQKLVDRVKASVTVTPEEAYLAYRKENTHIQADLVRFAKDDLARAEAFTRDVKEKIKSKKWTFQKAAKKMGLKVEETGFFKKTDSLPGLTSAWLLAAELEKLRVRMPTRPLVTQNGYAVFAKRAVYRPPWERFEKVRGSAEERVRRSKETTALLAFLGKVRQEANLKDYRAR